MQKPNVAIINYEMSNLASVRNAAWHCGLNPVITSSPEDIRGADAAILPGVGAFGDAMEALRRLKLDLAIGDFIRSGKPFVGICLGMQLLMDQSFEFGNHRGLGIVPGKVIRLDDPTEGERKLKVPHICWNRLGEVKHAGKSSWMGTLLEGMPDGFFMYFVHSFHVVPENSEVQIATTRYGNLEFCSALRVKNVFAFQGHPERSGEQGLMIYKNLLAHIYQAANNGRIHAGR